MRLFVAIDIPAEIKDALRCFVDRLRPAAKISWSPVDNLHITTKFIGDWPEPRLDQMKRALTSVTVKGAIDITVKGSWIGPGRLHLVPHVNAPVADFPVRKMVGAHHFVADLTLPYGRVLHDYLEPA